MTRPKTAERVSGNTGNARSPKPEIQELPAPRPENAQKRGSRICSSQNCGGGAPGDATHLLRALLPLIADEAQWVRVLEVVSTGPFETLAFKKAFNAYSDNVRPARARHAGITRGAHAAGARAS